MSQAFVVTKKGKNTKSEPFNRQKLHHSIFATCLSVYTPEGQAEIIANSVCDQVIIWLEKHPEVTNNDIRIIAAKNLKKHHPEAAYLYEQQHIII